MKPVLAWHFLGSSRKTRWSSRLVKVGQTLEWDGPLKLCESGLHASIKALDALDYAPGPIVCRVELSGEIVSGDDKLVASRRKCLAMNDATETLRYFARWCALSVIDKWDAPQVVLDYLTLGDKKLRNAARAAAWAAARAAAWGAAEDAAEAAAWAAAWATARAAAWGAAEAAAEAAAWAAAWATARAAAWGAVEAAAEAAAWAAAWATARAAAWGAVEAAAEAAAWAAAWATARAAAEAADVADAARAVAWDAVRGAQEKELSRLLAECLEVS